MIVSFSWDFVAAIVLFLALCSSFLVVFTSSSTALREGIAQGEEQRASLLQADLLLKTCFPEGVAYCENGFLHSHVAHPQANLSFESGFCAKRVVLQNGGLEGFGACA